jgi:hypothetical protein
MPGRYGSDLATVMWIRGPWWDGCWILSGLPIGFALLVLMTYTRIDPLQAAFLIMLLFQTAHTIAPMALAWSHDGFRAIMLRRPLKFIAFPGLLVVAGPVIGYLAGRNIPNLHFDPINLSIVVPATWAQFCNPFVAMAALYAAWNAYHFGKQTFGVMSIYRRKNELRGT